jgi:F-type H+-transporting ATPase subunit gamma
MANLKELKNKISSVKGTQKTTKAMKLVSTAKLRRAEVALKQSKEYAKKIDEVINTISARLVAIKESVGLRAFEEIDVKKVDLIFVTADKGLCGGFNVQTIKAVKKLVEEYKEKDIKVRLRAVGRKGIEYFKFNDYELMDEVIGLSASPDYTQAAEFIKESFDDFVNEKTDSIVLVHNGYVNKISQQLKINTLLPISLDSEASTEVLDVEPADDEEEVLNSLIQKYIEYSQFYTLLDSLAAEHSSRMQAMDAATNNAGDMVKELNLQYNKARQEAVTTELIEIISGMEALN